MSKILNFHKVGNAAWFEKVICLLKSTYQFVPADYLHEFYGESTRARNFCHITVDDGDSSFYDIIYPVLKKHKIPASLYVSPKICREQKNFWFQEIVGYNNLTLKKIIADKYEVSPDLFNRYDITCVLKCFTSNQIEEILHTYRKLTNSSLKPFQNMSVKQLAEVKESGLVAIGAHTMHHPILYNEDDKTSNYEIKQSIVDLQDLLHDQKIKYFAYPNGISNMDFGKREENSLKHAGIDFGFSTDYRNVSLNDNQMSIPRIGISSDENIYFLRAKLFLSNSWDKLAKLKVNSEYKQRKQLQKILKDHIFQENN